MGRGKIDAFKCDRCDYVWCPKIKDETPMTCPKCRSPYWDKPRKIGKKK